MRVVETTESSAARSTQKNIYSLSFVMKLRSQLLYWKGESAEIDNTPAELVQAGGETMTDVF